MKLPALSAVLAPALLAGSVQAQNSVLVVDPTDSNQYANIEDAVDAAAAGDVILVRSGNYGGFDVVGKGVTIVEDAGHTATIVSPVNVRDLPANEEFELLGIDIVPGPFSGGVPLAVQAADGRVFVEGALLQG